MKFEINKLLVIAFMCVVFSGKSVAQKKTIGYAKISGILSTENADSVRLFLYDHTFRTMTLMNYAIPTVFVSKVTNKRYSFNVPCDSIPQYFNLFRDNGTYPDKTGFELSIVGSGGLIEAGDNIHIESQPDSINNGSSFFPIHKLKFSGKGSSKLATQYLLNVNSQSLVFINLPWIEKWQSHQRSFKEPWNELDDLSLILPSAWAVYKTQENILKANEDRISLKSYQLLISRLYSETFLPALKSLYGKRALIAENDSLVHILKKQILKFSIDLKVPREMQERSYSYLDYYLYKLKCDMIIRGGKNVIDLLLSTPKTEFRDDAFMLEFLSANANNLSKENQDKIINAISNPEKKKNLVKFFQALQPGKTVFNFTLHDENDKSVRLSDFKGKIVFIDFWFTGCTACSTYYKTTVSKAEEKFKDNPNIVFITISTDQYKNKWLEGLNTGIYTSRSVVNLMSPKGMLDPVMKEYNVISAPKPMLIDEDGKLITVDEIALGRVNSANAVESKAIRLIKTIDGALSKIN